MILDPVVPAVVPHHGSQNQIGCIGNLDPYILNKLGQTAHYSNSSTGENAGVAQCNLYLPFYNPRMTFKSPTISSNSSGFKKSNLNIY